MSNKLKPCPCCKGKPEIKKYRFNHPSGKMNYQGKAIECACGLWTKYCRALKETVGIWNARAIDVAKEELDIQFLLPRANNANKISFGPDSEGGRDTGASSNSIVRIAYGYDEIENQQLPSDVSDLNACERMWVKLPMHRKTKAAQRAIRKARTTIAERGKN